jgi:hypothetical protein
MEYPLTAIKPDEKIVQNKHFESGICKIQGGMESKLTGAEAQAVKIFLKSQQSALTNHETPQRGYADDILDDAAEKKKKRVSASNYRCTNHVSPTTNIVERANSHSKLNMTERRSHMNPKKLEIIMILKLNKSLWPSEKTIQEFLDKLTEEQSESEDDEDDSDEEDEDENEDE